MQVFAHHTTPQVSYKYNHQRDEGSPCLHPSILYIFKYGAHHEFVPSWHRATLILSVSFQF